MKKKVLVAGAALMLSGALVVPAAVAEVNLSGDARLRYIAESGAIDRATRVETEDHKDRFDSRVRLNIKGVAKGGAFARARIRLGNGMWDGNGSLRRDGGGGARTDFAFIGIPMGAVTLYGGMVNGGLADFSDFFYTGGGETRMQVAYNGEGFNLVGFYQIDDEGGNTDDKSSIGLMADFAPADNMTVSTFLWYHMDDQGSIPRADRTGLAASLRFEGEMNTLALEAELSYRQDDLQDGRGDFVNDDGTAPDSGIGGYVGLSYDMGALTPGVQLGFASDGFAPGGDYGFLMIGDDSDPFEFVEFGDGQDNFWGALTADYKVSERITLSGNLVYLDMSDVEGVRGEDGDAFEISGGLRYNISEGVHVGYALGYLSGEIDRLGTNPDIDFDIVAHFVQFNIKF